MLTRLGEMPNPPKSLYHYTKTAGLKGIIETQIVHSSHYGFQNHISDGLHTLDFLIEEKEKYSDRTEHIDEAVRYVERIVRVGSLWSSPSLSPILR